MHRGDIDDRHRSISSNVRPTARASSSCRWQRPLLDAGDIGQRPPGSVHVGPTPVTGLTLPPRVTNGAYTCVRLSDWAARPQAAWAIS